MMGDLLLIFVGAMLVNNFTLAYFLGLCPFMGVSARVETALRMGPTYFPSLRIFASSRSSWSSPRSSRSRR